MQNAGARLFPGDYGYIDPDDLYSSESDYDAYPDCPYNTEEDEEDTEVITWPKLQRTVSDQSWVLKLAEPPARVHYREETISEPHWMSTIVNEGFDP